MRSRERGQATPLLAVVVLLAGLAALALARIGGEAVDQAGAATAADAAALAGAAEGRSAALAVAERNGARVQSFTVLGTDVVVVVRLGHAQARARARVTGGEGAEIAPPTQEGGGRLVHSVRGSGRSRRDDGVGRQPDGG